MKRPPVSELRRMLGDLPNPLSISGRLESVGAHVLASGLRSTVPAALIFCISTVTLGAYPTPEKVQTFLQKNCIECHDADTKKGGLDLGSLDFELTNAQTF